MTRLMLVAFLVGCSTYGVCQTGPTDAPAPQNQLYPASYETFFEQVIQSMNNRSGTVSLNGVPTELAQPAVQEVLGLTDEELQTLNTVASDCLSKTASLRKSVNSLVFEARLQLIASEKLPGQFTELLLDLKMQYAQLILDSIQRLKTALGDARFESLDTFVRSKSDGSFFPLARIGTVTSVPTQTRQAR